MISADQSSLAAAHAGAQEKRGPQGTRAAQPQTAPSDRLTLVAPGPKEMKDAFLKLQQCASDEFQATHGFKGASGNQLAKKKHGDLRNIFEDFQDSASLEALRKYQDLDASGLMRADEAGAAAAAPKAVLWLHGLGDTGDGWKGAFSAKLSGVEWHHPTAPTRAVTCNAGRQMPSWFDIVCMPVVVSEPENPKDFAAAVKDVHDMLLDIETEGVPADCIVLGGFSQGGAVSLQAGLSYSKRLAGVISISSWCPNRSDVTAWISQAGKETPVLMCCGDGDPDVEIGVTRQSAECLQAALRDTIEVRYPKRRRHDADPSELRAAVAFMKTHLGV